MDIYKPGEFAERIGVSVSTLQRWDRSGILKAQRTPTNRRYYTRVDVETYFRSNNMSHDGRWICISDGLDCKHKCSICGAVYELDDNFCGSCGARMVWDKGERQRLKDYAQKLSEGKSDGNER